MLLMIRIVVYYLLSLWGLKNVYTFDELLSMLHLDLRIRDVIVRYATIGTQLSFKKWKGAGFVLILTYIPGDWSDVYLIKSCNVAEMSL